MGVVTKGVKRTSPAPSSTRVVSGGSVTTSTGQKLSAGGKSYTPAPPPTEVKAPGSSESKITTVAPSTTSNAKQVFTPTMYSSQGTAITLSGTNAGQQTSQAAPTGTVTPKTITTTPTSYTTKNNAKEIFQPRFSSTSGTTQITTTQGTQSAAQPTYYQTPKTQPKTITTTPTSYSSQKPTYSQLSRGEMLPGAYAFDASMLTPEIQQKALLLEEQKMGIEAAYAVRVEREKERLEKMMSAKLESQMTERQQYYQSQVNAGLISVEQANALLEKEGASLSSNLVTETNIGFGKYQEEKYGSALSQLNRLGQPTTAEQQKIDLLFAPKFASPTSTTYLGLGESKADYYKAKEKATLETEKLALSLSAKPDYSKMGKIEQFFKKPIMEEEVYKRSATGGFEFKSKTYSESDIGKTRFQAMLPSKEVVFATASTIDIPTLWLGAKVASKLNTQLWEGIVSKSANILKETPYAGQFVTKAVTYEQKLQNIMLSGKSPVGRLVGDIAYTGTKQLVTGGITYKGVTSGIRAVEDVRFSKLGVSKQVGEGYAAFTIAQQQQTAKELQEHPIIGQGAQFLININPYAASKVGAISPEAMSKGTEAAEQTFINQGYSKEAAKNLARQVVQREFAIRGVGGFAALSASGAETEITGRARWAQYFAGLPKGAKYTTLQTIGVQAKGSLLIYPTLGFSEAITQNVITQLSQETPFDVEQVAKQGAGGAVSATLLGGVISTLSPIQGKFLGTKIKTSTISKTTEVGANIGDPGEPIGDFVTNLKEEFVYDITGIKTKVAGISTKKPGVYTFNVEQTHTKNVYEQSGIKTSQGSTATKQSVKNVNLLNFPQTPQKIKERTPITNNIKNEILSNTKSNTNIEIPTLTEARVETRAKTEIKVPSITKPQVQSRTQVQTYVKVPTVTSDQWLPLFPLGIGAGWGDKDVGGKGVGKSKGAYLPSFKALYLNIRGKAPSRSAIISGQGFRPIIGSASKQERTYDTFGSFNRINTAQKQSFKYSKKKIPQGDGLNRAFAAI